MTRINGLSESDTARYETFHRQKYEHPNQAEVLKRVWRSLGQARVEPHVTVLFGPTGVGKTNLVERIKLEAALRFRKETKTIGRVPFLGVRAAPPQHGTYRFPGMHRSILDAADEVLRSTRLSTPIPRTSDQLQDTALAVLTHRQPLVFVIDEAQHMTYAQRDAVMIQAIDNIKDMCTQTKVPILMVGTYELLRFSRVTGQLGRRMRHIGFAPYTSKASDLGRFIKAADHFRSCLPKGIQLAFEPEENVNFLFAGSAGSVGLLKQWFERALYLALLEGRRQLTLADFREERLDIGKLKTIIEENDRGLEELAELRCSDEELYQLVGLAPKKVVTTTPTTPRTTRVGRRTLGRDTVGQRAA